MQNVSTLVKRPVPIGTALIAFVAGATIAFGAPAVVASLSIGQGSNANVFAPATGGEQIRHNRSEAGPGVAGSAGGEQVAHNRSERGMAR